MQIYVLDWLTILTRPDLCLRTLDFPDAAIVVPRTVATWFERYGLSAIRDLLLTAEDAGSLKIEAGEALPNVGAERALSLTRPEYAVLSTAARLQKEGHNVVIVSTGSRLLKASADKAIPTIAPSSLATKLPELDSSRLRELVSPTTLRIAKRQGRRLGLQAFVALPLVGSLVWALDNRSVVAAFLANHTLVAIGACLGIALAAFGLRSRARLTYAILESAVGITLILTAFGGSNSDLVTADSVLKAAGGIYVLVRALDNVGKALSGTYLGLLWWQVFGE